MQSCKFLTVIVLLMAKNVENIPLKEARKSWLVAHVASLQLDTPAKEVSAKTGYDDSTVSLYLSGKRYPSVPFLQDYCKAYGLDFTEVNAQLVDDLKNKIIQNQSSKKDIYNDVKEKLSIQSITSTEPKNQDDMELIKFMQETITWQRSMMEALANKIPDADRDMGQHLHRKNA